MSEQMMDVFLLGAPKPGVARTALVNNLASAFKKDVPAIEKMLRRQHTLIKASVNEDLAKKYKALIEKAGGQCEVLPTGTEPEIFTIDTPETLAVTRAATLTIEPVIAPKPVIQEHTHTVDTEVTSYCVKCGGPIRNGQIKCSKCFTRVAEYTSKNKTTAGVLALFLGGVGAHRLYLGQWWGIVYLLLWWTLIPSIVSVIEAFVFWFSKQETWDDKYGHVKKSSDNIIIACVVAVFVFIFMAGILAAVALPAYQEYTHRAKIHSAMPLVAETQNKVAGFIKKMHSYPNDNILVGLPDDISNDVIESIHLGDDAALTVTYRLQGMKDKNTIVWTPIEKGSEVVWDCKKGTMLDKYRPPECRGGEGSSSSVSSAALDLTKKISSEDKHLSIRTPVAWHEETLVAGAPIGVASNDDNYVVVLEDTKADLDGLTTLNEYVDFTQKKFMTNVKDGELVGKEKVVTIANLPGEQFVIQGTAQGIKISYVVTVLVSDKHFYRILAWTKRSQFEKNKSLLESVSASMLINK